MVAEDRAEVVSTASLYYPSDEHIQARNYKQIVFIVKELKHTDKHANWIKQRDGGLSPVMCEERWSLLTYEGSTCYIPGIIPDTDEKTKELMDSYNKQTE